jgi:hypothetical protein
MRCAHCEAEFTPKRTTGKYCSTRCRAAAWQRQRNDELALVEEQLSRALTRVRVLRGTAKDRD